MCCDPRFLDLAHTSLIIVSLWEHIIQDFGTPEGIINLSLYVFVIAFLIVVLC